MDCKELQPVNPKGVFSGGSVVKNLPANGEDAVLILGSGRSPGGENGNPLQYSCLENSMDRRAWWATVCAIDHKESDMTEQLTHTNYILQ